MINPIVRPIVNAIADTILGGHGSAGVSPPAIADVFSADLYAGNGTSQSIDNGFDFTAVTGAVWIKSRSLTVDHNLFDTERGATKRIFPNLVDAEVTQVQSLSSFNSNGYSLGSNSQVNANTNTYVAWSFLKAARFFDVITYTGNSAAGREIPHNLSIVPGWVVVKKISTNGDWPTQHISRGGTKTILLNENFTEATNTAWNNTAATDSVVTLGTLGTVNATGSSYVMYVFAHDPADNGVIQCGQYTGNGSSSGPSINLGWKPQYIIIKRVVGGTGDWIIIDTARGIPAGNDPSLAANTTATEVTTIDYADLTATGFDIATTNTNVNASGSTYIFMAIREA